MAKRKRRRSHARRRRRRESTSPDSGERGREPEHAEAVPRARRVPDSWLSEPEHHLQSLEQRFLQALEMRQSGETDQATRLFREVLQVEPRLAEPRMELAHIHLQEGRLAEAEAEAREAVRILEAGGQWTLDLPERSITGLAHNLLGEALRRQAETDEVIFGDESRFHEITIEARKHFGRAAELDPDNEHAQYQAWTLQDALPGGFRSAEE